MGLVRLCTDQIIGQAMHRPKQWIWSGCAPTLSFSAVVNASSLPSMCCRVRSQPSSSTWHSGRSSMSLGGAALNTCLKSSDSVVIKARPPSATERTARVCSLFHVIPSCKYLAMSFSAVAWAPMLSIPWLFCQENLTHHFWRKTANVLFLFDLIPSGFH